MTRYEKIKNLIYKFRNEEKKVMNQPGNKWGDECYMVRTELQNQLNSLTLSEACEVVE